LDELLSSPEAYGKDRLFIYLRSDGLHDVLQESLREAGQPVIVLPLTDPYEFGAECYRWEVAIAVACSILGVNAFDQPDVQDSKDRTKSKIAAYIQNGSFETRKPVWQGNGISAYSPHPHGGGSLQAVLGDFLNTARQGDYVGINAYLPRNASMTAALSQLRLGIGERTRCATTLGFGPRFLHSTGQLHKGGPAEGLFLQITMDGSPSLSIPTQGITFDVLEQAQALGDYEALIARGRRVLSIHLRDNESLEQLIKAI
jgi:transaldolase/glucose-6-phosphate isomerase